MFAMFEITDIERKLLRDEVEPFFCIGFIIAVLKLSGTLFWVIHKLKMWHNGVQKIILCFFNRPVDILFRPGDEPFFNSAVASKISSGVMGSNLFRKVLFSNLLLLNTSELLVSIRFFNSMTS